MAFTTFEKKNDVIQVLLSIVLDSLVRKFTAKLLEWHCKFFGQCKSTFFGFVTDIGIIFNA
jgi:hypothetical protein